MKFIHEKPTFLIADSLLSGVTDLLDGRFTPLYHLLSRLPPANLLLLAPALLPGQLELDVNTDLLQLHLLHPGLTGDTGHCLGDILTYITRFLHHHVLAYFSGYLSKLQKCKYRKKYSPNQTFFETLSDI